MSADAYIYILASKRNGTLYIGVTNNIARRVYEHRTKPRGFVKRYGLYLLVYYAEFDFKWYAVRHETSMKRWSRAMKIEYIEYQNPTWKDLAADWVYYNERDERVVLGEIKRLKPEVLQRKKPFFWG